MDDKLKAFAIRAANALQFYANPVNWQVNPETGKPHVFVGKEDGTAIAARTLEFTPHVVLCDHCNRELEMYSTILREEVDSVE